MKILLYASALAMVGSCATLSHKEKIRNITDNINIEQPDKIVAYASTITAKELEKHLYTFASDAFEGRKTGSPGHKLAANYLKNYYINESISSPLGGTNYFQIVPKSLLGKNYNDSENVLAFIEGSKKPDEVIIVSAHLDHEGITIDGEVNNGADDDGSGTVAILEMAQAFKKAKAEILLKDALLNHLNRLGEARQVMLKLTLPEQENFYDACIDHPNVLKVVALSGGYSRDEANRRLANNHGMVASFSRALTEGLSAQQSDDEFNSMLDESVESIYQASCT